MKSTSREFIEDRGDAYISTLFDNSDPNFKDVYLRISDGNDTIHLCNHGEDYGDLREFKSALLKMRKHIDNLIQLIDGEENGN